jgi:3-deoxy-D-manno-octulosonic-acid transferase
VSILFYSIVLGLYQAGVRLISPWNPKARLWLRGRKDIFRKIATAGLEKEAQVVWMHCASLGEFEQGRPLLEKIRAEFPATRIVLTFFSPSGYEIKKDYRGADYIFYLPADSRKNARRFIESIHPSLVLWIKYDYWFYYLDELNKQNIPALLVSAVFRPDQAFFKWYGRLHRYMLACFNHIFVQTTESSELLKTIRYSSNVSVSGDTRFDRVIAIADHFESIPLIEKFCEKKQVVVAGSTWEEDEEQLDHYANTHPDIRFILAPHEIDEDHLKEMEGLFRKSVRFSVWEKQSTTERAESDINVAPRRVDHQQAIVNVLIIDNIGMLSRLYRYATISYVGGGFGDDGVHNVLEAAVYGKPVVMGPVIDKYVEALELVDTGGAVVIDSALEAEAAFNRLFANLEEYKLRSEASRNYVYAKKGATAKVMAFIQEKRLLTN